MIDTASTHSFPAKELLDWFSQQARDLPWREAENPYQIWVSEIMLQQTRVETVIPYYRRFLEAFPTLDVLASADRTTLLKVWEGLGYYNRARNLQDAARQVVDEYGGHIPDTYNGLLQLKGVGPYTAAAVASIAFGRAHAAVDGNVIRVLSRYFLVEEDVRHTQTRRHIQELANSILDKNQPGDFNQALMELGATICSVSGPRCEQCPLSSDCLAFRTSNTGQLPYKSPSKPIPHHQIGVGILRDSEGRLLIALRPENVMLGGLWEFPGGKQKESETLEETVQRELAEELDVSVVVEKKFLQLDHAYTHFRITMHAYFCSLHPESLPPRPNSSQQIRWVDVTELVQFPFPKANRILTKRLKEKLMPS